MTTEIMMTNKQFMALREKHQGLPVNISVLIRDVEQAVLQSPEVQALRNDAERMRRNTLLDVLGKLHSNPYSLTKSECIDVVREMFEEADAAMEQQK